MLIFFAFGVCAIFCTYFYRADYRLDDKGMLLIAYLFSVLLPFVLPHMHERYFYLADILSVALAAYDKKAAPVCALVVFASFSCYWETLFSLPVCALMMLAALIMLPGCTDGAAASPQQDQESPVSTQDDGTVEIFEYGALSVEVTGVEEKRLGLLDFRWRTD